MNTSSPLQDLWSQDADQAFVDAYWGNLCPTTDEVFVPLAMLDPEEAQGEAQADLEASFGTTMLAAYLMTGPLHLVGEALHGAELGQELADASLRQFSPQVIEQALRTYRLTPTPVAAGSRPGVYIPVGRAPSLAAAMQAKAVLAARQQARQAAQPSHTPAVPAASPSEWAPPVLRPSWAKSIKRPWA